MPNGKGNQRGFAYLAVMAVIAAMSVAALQMAGSEKVRMQREKEQILLFNGNQIAQAVGSYYESGPVKGCYPPDLEALLEDRRNFRIAHHLRNLYRDPLTADGQWDLLTDEDGRIMGVRSKSREKPFKQDGFSRNLMNFNGKSHYAEWAFMYKRGTVPPASAAVCAQQ
ncbi:MAG: hypothetical protein JWP38_738 [Herbaspirillum sp.]|nr:hypothetical protein [Herbaspirillum sp.]